MPNNKGLLVHSLSLLSHPAKHEASCRVSMPHPIHRDQNAEPQLPANPPLGTLMLSKRISEWSQVHRCANEEERQRLLCVLGPTPPTTLPTHAHRHITYAHTKHCGSETILKTWRPITRLESLADRTGDRTGSDHIKTISIQFQHIHSETATLQALETITPGLDTNNWQISK